MCFFGGGGGASGPQSSADKAAGGYTPPGKPVKPTAQQIATQNQQTTDKNTMRRAGDSNYKVEGTNTTKKSNTTAVASGRNTMAALTSYNKNKTNKKTILGS